MVVLDVASEFVVGGGEEVRVAEDGEVEDYGFDAANGVVEGGEG